MSAATPSPARTGGKLTRHTPFGAALVIVLALAVVCFLIYRFRGAIRLEGFSWERLAEAGLAARPGHVLLALGGVFVAYALRALRWVQLCRYMERATFANVYESTLVGFAAIFVLGRAGEPIRPLLIARKDRLPVSSMFGIYVLERIFDTSSTAVLAGLTLLIFPSQTLAGSESRALLAAARTSGLLLIVGVLAAAFFLVYFRLHGSAALERRMAEWKTRRGWHARVAGLFSGFGEGLGAIRNLRDLGAALGVSAAHWILMVFIYLWVMNGFGGRLADLDFPAAMLVLAFTMVGSTLQLPGVGGGSQVASFLALTVVFGVEKEPAAAASILLWLVTFAAVSLVGVPLLIREGWSVSELRQLARAEAAAEATGTHIPVPELHPAGSVAGREGKEVRK
jgi:hypothetical protein